MKKLALTLLYAVMALTIYSQNANNEFENIPLNSSQLPVTSPYYLVHQYISVLAPEIAEKDAPEILGSPEILNSVSAYGNGFRSPFRDEDIKVEKFNVEGKDIYVWRFPEPEYLREALYVAFFPINGKYKAFSICIGQWVDWEVSASDEKKRSVFGRIKKPESARECVDLLVSRGALTGHITPGEFVQQGYSGPEYRK